MTGPKKSARRSPMKTITVPVTFDLDALRAALGTSAKSPKAPSVRGRHLKAANARTKEQRAARVAEARDLILKNLSFSVCTRRDLLSVVSMADSLSVPGGTVGYNATAAAFSALLTEGAIVPTEDDLSSYRRANA